MEAFVFLSTCRVAVVNTSTFARNSEYVSLGAEFAITNPDSFLLLVLVGELLGSDFDYDQLIGEILIAEVESCADVWFDRLSGEFDTGVLLDVRILIVDAGATILLHTRAFLSNFVE